jgi:hypothetical protein
MCYGMGLGLGLTCLYMFSCGVLGFLNIESVILFFILAVSIGYKELVFVIRDVFKKWNDLKSTSWDFSSLALLVVIFLSGMALVIGAFGPIYDYDALEYHVGIPDLYARAGKIHFLPNNVYSHFPMNVEMLYLFALLLGKVEFIKFFNFLFVVMTVFLVYHYADRWWGRKIGLGAAALFICSNHLAINCWAAKSDVGHVYFCSVAVFLLLDRSFRSILLAAIFGGLALGSKSIAPFYVWGALAGSWFSRDFLQTDRTKLLVQMILFLFVSSLFAAPWWIKNFLETGDPVFPLGFAWFKSPIWSVDQYQRWWDYHTVSKNLADFFSALAGSMIKYKNFWPTVYLGLPIVLFCLRETKIRFLMFYAGLGYIFFFVGTIGDPRFLLPVFPCLVVAVAGAFAVFKSSLPKKITITVMSVFIFLNLGSMAISLEILKIPKYFFGLISQAQYLREILPHYSAVEFLNLTMKPNDQVLFIGEARTFYVKGKVVASTVFDRSVLGAILDGVEDDKEVYERFKKKGINYLLVNLSEIQRWDKGVPEWRKEIDWNRFENFLRRISPVYDNPQTFVKIYKIDEDYA